VIIDKFILLKTGKVAKMKAGGGKTLTFREVRPRIQIGYEKIRKLEKATGCACKMTKRAV
jgi:hypothetical protein